MENEQNQCDKILFPIYGDMTDEDVERIVSVILSSRDAKEI